MGIEELLEKIGIKKKGQYSKEKNYVIDLDNSDEYGRIFSKLEKSELVNILQENQVVTEEGSSLLYEVEDEEYLINLIADFEQDKYQLVVLKI